MKYLWILLSILLLSGCSLVSNSTGSSDKMLEFMQQSQKEDDVSFQGPRPAMGLHQTVNKPIHIEGASSVTIQTPSEDKDVAHLNKAIKDLDKELAQVLTERDIALKAKMTSERATSALLEEHSEYVNSSGLYYILMGIGYIIIVVAFGLFLFIVRRQLGIRTEKLGGALGDVAKLTAGAMKWKNRTTQAIKNAKKRIKEVDSTIAHNNISADAKARLGHEKNHLRDLIDDFTGQHEIE